jgi:hypothetical protein
MHRWILSTAIVSGLLLASASGFADATITSMRFDNEFMQDMGDRCRYRSSIHGTLTPVQGSPQTVDPKLDIQASVSCPNMAPVQLTDKIMDTGPMPQDQVERLLEQRTTVIVSRNNRRCFYSPDLTLAGPELKLKTVKADCK